LANTAFTGELVLSNVTPWIIRLYVNT